MQLETLRLWRNLLLRTFAAGFGMTLLLGLVTMAGWQTWMGLATGWFHTDSQTLTPLVLNFFLQIRFFLLFLVLAPALALHWTLHVETARAGR